MKKLTVIVDGPKGSGVTRTADWLRGLTPPFRDNNERLNVVDMSEVRDGQSNTWDELQDEISDAIGDSFDMDWTATDGAKAVVRMLQEQGYSVVRRGEDSDVAIAIGEDAFKGGWASGVAWAKSEGFHMPDPDVAVKPMFDAWSDYTPPEDLCGRALS